jgi:hypothetical protein
MGKAAKLISKVGAFLALLLTFEATATEVEVGPTNLSGDMAGFAVLLTEDVGKWSFLGGYISEQEVDTCPRPDCHFEIEPNIFFGVQRIVTLGDVELGVGPTWFQNTNRALGANINWGLSIGYRWDKVSVRFRHASCGGSCKPNMGQDILTIGYEF